MEGLQYDAVLNTQLVNGWNLYFFCQSRTAHKFPTLMANALQLSYIPAPKNFRH